MCVNFSIIYVYSSLHTVQEWGGVMPCSPAPLGPDLQHAAGPELVVHMHHSLGQGLACVQMQTSLDGGVVREGGQLPAWR